MAPGSRCLPPLSEVETEPLPLVSSHGTALYAVPSFAHADVGRATFAPVRITHGDVACVAVEQAPDPWAGHRKSSTSSASVHSYVFPMTASPYFLARSLASV